MSTDFRPMTPIQMDQLFDGRLAQFGIREEKTDTSDVQRRCLTDGKNYVWVYGTESGRVGSFSRNGANSASHIIGAIEDLFDVTIVSEHHPSFWGFATERAWLKPWENVEESERFLEDLKTYIATGETQYSPGEIGYMLQRIGRFVISMLPELQAARNREKLEKLLAAVLEEHELVFISETNEEIAALT
jgi:hypothetical protein